MHSVSLRAMGRMLAVAMIALMPGRPADLGAQDATPASEVEAREIAFAKTMADRDFEAFLTFVSEEWAARIS